VDQKLPDSILGPWHDFFTLIGSASATLVGLMFVAASVGSGVFTEERQAGLRTFLSPTVVAFSVVLAVSLVGLLPVSRWVVSGGLLGGIGLLGTVYSGLVWRRMLREGIAQKIDLEDRILYVVVPALAYLILAAAGVSLICEFAVGSLLLAGGICLLLLAGIRNAWDMTTWVVMRRGG
jgi:predicted neutral ceramidase superfamily lipid hydrolase